MARPGTAPYGPLVETTLRVATWNLWWRFGDWKAPADAIGETLEELRPDVVCLQEVWQEGRRNQAALLAERLGFQHAFALERSGDGVDQGLALCRAGGSPRSSIACSPHPPVYLALWCSAPS